MTPPQSQPQSLLDQIRQQAVSSGHVLIAGEMEFDCNCGPSAAFTEACNIAECCGYSVSWRYGHSAFSVSGPCIVGEYVFDWFHPETRNLQKIDYWTVKSAYTDLPTNDQMSARTTPAAGV